MLTQLSVAGDASIALAPAFAPDIHDYYVRCAAGANAWTVEMAAASGSESELLQPETSPRLPRQRLSLMVSENQAIVAAASDGTTTTSYWIRCLPPDFPPLRMMPHPDAGSPPKGYYLVGDFRLLSSDGSYAMILDSNGAPVWYFKGAPGGIGDVDDVVSGAISFISFFNPTAPFEARTLDPPATTLLAPTNVVVDGHELRTVDGGYIVISNPVETGVDLTGVSVPGASTLGPNSNIQGCNLVEFDANGTVTWQWTGSLHLDPVKDSTLPELATTGPPAPDGGVLVDPYHCNSIDVDPANGNLLVSARNMDSIFYVDRTTGAILWKMGGATYTKDNATYVTANDPFYRQHDARLLPGWSACGGGHGQISLFDDESLRAVPARAAVYDLLVGEADGGHPPCADGGAPGTATLVWQYSGTVSSLGIGSFRISQDGSRVIGWGFSAADLVFTEVDEKGADLLDFEFTDGNTSYRAIKVPLGTFDLSSLRTTAGLP